METGREAREKHARHREEGTKRSEQDMQRNKDKHDHTREKGLAVVTRRSLRALAGTLRQPASCTQAHQDPARHAPAGQIQRWSAPCSHVRATESPRARPDYARGRLVRPGPSSKAVRACTCKPNPVLAPNARAPAVQTRATRLRTRHQASSARRDRQTRPGCVCNRQARPTARPAFWVDW